MPSISAYREALCAYLCIPSLSRAHLLPFINCNHYNLQGWLNRGESVNLTRKDVVVSLYHWVLANLPSRTSRIEDTEIKEPFTSDRLMDELWNDTAFLRDDDTEFRDTLEGFKILTEDVMSPLERFKNLGSRMLGLCERLVLRHPLALILRKVD